MIHDDHFHMPEVSIRVSKRCGEFDVVIRLENMEEYSISGFPRLLAGKRAQTGSKSCLLCSLHLGGTLADHTGYTRDKESSVASIRRRSQWTPPTSPRYSSFFNSGLELDDGSHLAPAVSSLAKNLATNDTPLSKRRPKGPPYELEAVDPRKPSSILGEMMIQHERDRVRKEEVAPLERENEKLKATTRELTARIAGLQSLTSEVPAQLTGTASKYLIDGPLINLNSSNPSRRNTVRHEKQSSEENSDFNDIYDP